MVWPTSELQLHDSSGTLNELLQRAQSESASYRSGLPLGLVLVGKKSPELESRISELQLELAISVRRVDNEPQLADLLATYARPLNSLAKKVTGTDHLAEPEDFLGGLSARDVLNNKKSRIAHRAPRNHEEAWLGALQQIVPDNTARAIFNDYPSFRRLYEEYKASGDHADALLENIQIGKVRRLGRARSAKIHRILMATVYQAFDELGTY